MAKLIAGIIGAGGITDYHINGYRAAGAEVKAIADPAADRARERAKKHGISAVYSSYQEMLDKQRDISLVSICVPNKFHAGIAVDCLNAGRHVFCEKPPAINSAEAETMKSAADAKGVRLMFDFNNRARPEAQALLKYIRSGETGVINSAQALWTRRCGIPGFGGWFTQKALSGGGPVIDLLHMIDLALYFMGFPEPAHVLAGTFSDFARNPEFKGPWGLPDVENPVVDVEMASHALITFTSGQVLFARNSWAEMNKREEVSVTFQGARAGGLIRRLFGRDGLDGTAVDDCELYTMEHGRPVNRTISVEPDEKMGRERAVVNFVRTIEGTEEPFSNAGEAVILMRIIEAIYRSAETKQPVSLTACR